MEYKLRYTVMFQDDLNEILDYITYKLQNPIAANRFLDALEAAIQSCKVSPLSCAPYASKKERAVPYYVLNVKNYSAFYVVRDETIEFRRLLYSRSNLDAKLD